MKIKKDADWRSNLDAPAQEVVDAAQNAGVDVTLFDVKLFRRILGCNEPLDLSVFRDSDPEFYEEQMRVQSIVEQREKNSGADRINTTI